MVVTGDERLRVAVHVSGPVSSFGIINKRVCQTEGGWGWGGGLVCFLLASMQYPAWPEGPAAPSEQGEEDEW